MKRLSTASLIMLLCLAIAVPASAKKKDVPPKVKSGSKVTLNYIMMAGDAVVESSDEGGPLVFTVGKGEVLPGLEREVIGLSVGEIKDFTLGPEEAYGRATEPVRELPLSILPPGVVPEERMVLVYDDPESGRKRFITILEVKEKSVVVDFNHPLAGKDIDFEIEILSIE